MDFLKRIKIHTYVLMNIEEEAPQVKVSVG